MGNFLSDLFWRFEHSTYKAAALVCFATFFMFLRTVLETMSAGLFARSDKLLVVFVGTSYILWYFATFLIILACFRYIARVPLGSVVYILFATVILVEPVFASTLAGEQAHFMYLSPKDPNVFNSILSLMYLSPTNHHMFYELVSMAVGIPIIAYFFCRDVMRSLLTWACAYAAMIFLNFFVFICSAAICVYVADSYIPISIYLCFYTIVITGAWVCVFLFPELRRYLHAEDTIFTQWNLFLGLLLFIPYGIVSILMSGYFFDLLFLFASYFIFFYISLFLYNHWKEKSLTGLNTFFAIYGGLILATFALTTFRFFS